MSSWWNIARKCSSLPCLHFLLCVQTEQLHKLERLEWAQIQHKRRQDTVPATWKRFQLEQRNVRFMNLRCGSTDVRGKGRETTEGMGVSGKFCVQSEPSWTQISASVASWLTADVCAVRPVAALSEETNTPAIEFARVTPFFFLFFCFTFRLLDVVKRALSACFQSLCRARLIAYWVVLIDVLNCSFNV